MGKFKVSARVSLPAFDLVNLYIERTFMFHES